MKRKTLFYVFLLFISGITLAQKKPVKRLPPKVPKIKIPAPKKAEKVKDLAPPTIDSSPSVMYMPSPGEINYERGKICTTCDTLVLEPGKPYILIYDIKWMSDHQSKTYKDQPTEKDLKYKYFALNGLEKREWDELHNHFLETDVNYRYIFRNTFIKIPNTAQENLNFLDRQDRHVGFLYWSGNASDKILHSKNMVLTTEQIAKYRGENKKSSYCETFKRDSLTIENFTKTTFASKNVMQQLNVIVSKYLLNDNIIPFQFMDTKKVQKITLTINNEKKLYVMFNTLGQLTGIENNTDKKVVVYKNELPVYFTENDKIKDYFYFQDNTVIVKNNYAMKIYQLVGKLFLSENYFSIDKPNYEKLNLNHTQYKINTENDISCEFLSYTDSDETSSECYSNNQWKLPITVTYVYNNTSETTTYTQSANGDIVVETINPYKSKKIVYQIENQILKTIKYYKKQDNEDYKELVLINAEYEFYK